MCVYIYIFTGERETWGREEEGEKGLSVCTLEREESPSERRRVVRERDRVGARRLAVAVRAAGRALVDGPEHDAAHLSVLPDLPSRRRQDLAFVHVSSCLGHQCVDQRAFLPLFAQTASEPQLVVEPRALKASLLLWSMRWHDCE